MYFFKTLTAFARRSFASIASTPHLKLEKEVCKMLKLNSLTTAIYQEMNKYMDQLHQISLEFQSK